MQWRHLVRILIWPSIFCDADLERFTLCLYNCFLKNPNSPNSFFSRLIFASVSSFSLTDGCLRILPDIYVPGYAQYQLAR